MHHDSYIEPHPCYETTEHTELTEGKQQGGNRGRAASQISQLHAWLSLSQSPKSIYHFWGEMKIVMLLHHWLPGTACCPAQHGVHGEDSCGQLCPWVGSWPWGHVCVCACYCNMQLFCQPAPHSTCTAWSNYAYWWHGLLPKIRFSLIKITKTALQGKYFGIWALLALLFDRKLMASLALLSRWTM